MIRLTRAQVREVDRRAMEEYHIPGIVLMENAALAVAEAAAEMLQTHVGSVLIVCGGGNNGGDGLATARHLHNRGVDVEIAVAIDPAKYAGDALINWRIAQAMKLPCRVVNDELGISKTTGLLIDGLFGTGLTRPPRAAGARLIQQMNESGLPILSIDVPSGMDCDSGQVLGDSCVRATRTVTFITEKAGFAKPSAYPYLGRVSIGEIGCPPRLVNEVAAQT